MRLRPLVATLSLLSLSTLLPACGLIDKIRGGDDDEPSEEAGEAGEAEDKPEATPDTTAPTDKPRTTVLPTGLDRFKHWSPLHAFIGAPTVVAQALSGQELIVATMDAHVGVSKDGGTTWQWTKSNDWVRDVTGYAGGPYVLLHEGALSVSDDGLLWRRLPRYTWDSLIDVVAADIGLVAIGKNGAFVHVNKDGSLAHEGTLPDKFKPKAVIELNGAVLAWSGKTGYGTTDGQTWTQLEQLPPMPAAGTYLTSAGSCSIAKVGKKKGVACKVSGTAHGIGSEFVVENKGITSLTRDGGKTWETAALPFSGANSIFGGAGGPYYALGNSGKVAISKDGGKTWVDQKWEESANLLDGAVSGSNVVIVGAKGTIVYSSNAGSSWDYAEAPTSKNLSFITHTGGNFVASDGKTFFTSSNGAAWVEAPEAAIELPGKPGPCEGSPADGAQCKFDASVTTPDSLPDVRGLTFTGNVGLALGDKALVAVSQDGGATWSSAHGLALGKWGAFSFSAQADQLLATDGSKLLASTDAGKTWIEGELLRSYKINAVHVSTQGLWLAAAKDEILRAKLDPKTWLPAAAEPIKGDWRTIFEVGGVLYMSNTKGELRRSEDGDNWLEVTTGIPSPIIDMAGEGQNVWASTAPTRKMNNVLLRSEDGGKHFIVVQEMPGSTDSPDLRVTGDAVMWSDMVSRDNGETWKRETENYFPGQVDIADGSGMFITNLVYNYGPDRLYVITGSGEYDWVRIDSAFNEGGVIECEASSGCWMLARGVLYRPLGS
jgi:photosystem II stability/assembly factor-like uncharacterized protein